MAGPAAKPQAEENWKGRRGSMGGGGKGGGGVGEGITATEHQQMEVFVMLFNYTCKFEKSLRVEAQETGSLFFFYFSL